MLKNQTVSRSPATHPRHYRATNRGSRNPHFAGDNDPAVLGDVVLGNLLEQKDLLLAGHGRVLRPEAKFLSESAAPKIQNRTETKAVGLLVVGRRLTCAALLDGAEAVGR
jgi:hypothetical protein